LALAGAFAYFKGFAADAADHHYPAELPHEGDQASRASGGTIVNIGSSPASHSGQENSSSHPSHKISNWDDPFILSDEPALSFATNARKLNPHYQTFSQTALPTVARNDNGARSFSPETGAHRPVQFADIGDVVLPVHHGPAAPSHQGTIPTPGGSTGTTAPPPSGSTSADKPPTTGTTDPQTNRKPVLVGPVRLNDVVAGQAMLLGLGDLLLGARDPDGDALHVSNLHVSTGEIAQIDGSWAYHANAGGEGPVTLSYDIDDGSATVSQTASFEVLSEVHILTPADDVYVGSTQDDQIDGAGGHDVIDGRDGADAIWGGSGDDHIQGGAGDDTLSGQAGDDVIFGGDGTDIIIGGNGNDRLFGGAGNDIMSGDAADDYLAGEDGNDILHGGAGNDVLDGGSGNDILDAGTGSNTVLGGIGNDLIVDGPGDDKIDGGAGTDTLDLSAARASVTIDLLAGVSDGADIGHNSIASVEKIVGGSGNDTFLVGHSAVEIAGGSGDDLFELPPAEAQGSATAQGAHLDIVDFAVGDRIRIGEYDLREWSNSDAHPQFDDLYSQGVPAEANLPIQVREERFNDLDVTLVEGNLDRNDIYEILVSLHGHHNLTILLHSIA
jgi:hypothetical protein